MIPPRSTSEDLPSVGSNFPFAPPEFARLQCALYFELLRLAGRVLRQYAWWQRF